MSAQPILGLAMSTLTVLTWTGHQAIHRNEIRSYNGVTLSKRIPWILFYRFPGVFLMTSLLTHLSNRTLRQTLPIGGSMVTNHFRIRSHVVRSPPYCQFVVNLIVSLWIVTLSLLGFQVAWQKVTGPSTLTTFLGINIDSVGIIPSHGEG